MPPVERVRDRAVARLRDGYACGDLGTATFERRIDAALAARSAAELRGLTVDLPATKDRWRRWVATARRWLWPGDLLAPEPGGLLVLAAQGQEGRFTLGRSPRCELVLSDDTVSRRHATLCLRADGWYVVDHDSSNGTWVAGRRVFDAEVRAGEEIRVGAVRLRL